LFKCQAENLIQQLSPGNDLKRLVVVIAVTGRAKIVAFDTFQVQFKIWDAVQAKILFIVELGDVLVGDPEHMGFYQFSERCEVRLFLGKP
jgi:hypothetical protein